MPTIISPPKQNKQVECKKCNAIIGYNLSEVKEDYTTDYTGGKDYYSFISCPCCGSEIHVKSY